MTKVNKNNSKKNNYRIAKMEVMPAPCHSCPFEGTEPIQLGAERHAEIVADVVNLNGQHLCHTAKNKKLCRGGRNLLLRVLCAMRLIDQPTDEAFTEKSKQLRSELYFL